MRLFTNPDPTYLSDGTSMRGSHAVILPNLPQTSMSNKTAQICPSNKNISLVSFGKLCYDYCEEIINKKTCTIYK